MPSIITFPLFVLTSTAIGSTVGTRCEFYVRVRYCSCHENIKFISSSQRVMFFLIYGETIQKKQKAGIVTLLNDTTFTKVTYGKHATRVPDEVAYGIYEWLSSQKNTLLHIINLFMRFII